MTVYGENSKGRLESKGEIMEEFSLEGRESIKLNDLLKLKGLCATGGMAKVAISEGLVTVDGKVETRKRCKIRTGQVVEFDGHAIAVK